MSARWYICHDEDSSRLKRSMSGVFANLPPTDGQRGGAVPKASAAMGSYEVRKAQGSDRPNYGAGLIAAADRRHDTDPAIRKRENWL